MPRPRSAPRVEETAQLLRIDHLLDQPVSGLAGGDRQRVALGRAIVRRPKCFLMDEPLGTLDTEFRDLMVRELRELHNRINATTVYVTHDQLEAMAMADKIAVMNHGVIEQFGTPQEIYDRPASHVRRRLHRLAADELPAVPRRASRRAPRRSAIDGAEIAVPDSRARTCRAGELVLGVRPEHIRFDDDSQLARRGLRRRISRHHADRHGRHARARSSRRALPADVAVKAGRDRSASRSTRRRLSLFDAASGRAIRTALHEEARHG